MAGHGHTTINYHSVKRNAGSPASYLLKKGGTESLVQRPSSFLHWQPCGWGYRKAGALWLLHEYTPIEKLCSVNRWNPRKNGAGQVFLTANSGLIAPLLPLVPYSCVDSVCINFFVHDVIVENEEKVQLWPLSGSSRRKQPSVQTRINYILFRREPALLCFSPCKGTSNLEAIKKIIVFTLLTFMSIFSLSFFLTDAFFFPHINANRLQEAKRKGEKTCESPLLPHLSHILVYSHVSITHRDYSSLSSFVLWSIFELTDHEQELPHC